MNIRNVLFVLTLLVSLTVSAQTEQDIVYLKNGETVSGKIVKREFQGFNAPVQIRIADGSVLTFQMDDVEMIKYAATSVSDNANGIKPREILKALRELEEITIPSSMTEIKSYTFYGCVNLKKVTIPESVTKINDGAFYYCSKLNIITCLNIEPPKCQSGALLGLKTKSCVLYVPKGSKEAYSRAKGWKSFKHIEEME